MEPNCSGQGNANSKRKAKSQGYIGMGIEDNKRNRRLFGYMVKPSRQVEITSSLDGQTEESSQAQLSNTQVLHQPPQVLEPPKLTRQEVKAKRACYYCKEEGHLIRSCPKKRLHRLEKKTLKQDPTDGYDSNIEPCDPNITFLNVHEYDELGKLTSIRFVRKREKLEDKAEDRN